MRLKVSGGSLNQDRLALNNNLLIETLLHQENLDRRSSSSLSQKRSSSQLSATFRSKVPRLAPAMGMIGLAPELIPSHLENPGPGHYYQINSEDY